MAFDFLVRELIFAIRLHLHSFLSNHILCRISMLNFWKTIRQKAVEVALVACKRIVRRNLFSRDNGSHTIQIMVQVIKKFLFRPICTSWPEVCCCALLSNVSIAESSGWLFRNCFALCVCVPFKHLLMSVLILVIPVAARSHLSYVRKTESQKLWMKIFSL